MRKLLLIAVMAMTLSACSEASRLSTIDTVHYEDGTMTVLFKDGLVVTTTRYDDIYEAGDKVRVRHLTNGEIKITKE